MKILEFKNKKQIFNEWLNEVKEANFKDQEVKHALFLWELPATKEGYQVIHSKFDCDLEQLKFFHRCLGEHIKELEFDKFLEQKISDYIE